MKRPEKLSRISWEGRRTRLLLLCAAASWTLAAYFSEDGDSPADVGAVVPCDQLVLPALTGATPAGALASLAQDAAVRVVAIRGFAFRPSEVRVQPGTTVVWINCEASGVEAHNARANDDTWVTPLTESGEIVTRTFEEAGVYEYHCEPHPFMTGRIVVEE